jgi:hypothetical protein
LVDDSGPSKPTVENKIYVLPTSTCRDLVGTTSPTEFLGPSRRLKTDNKILYITNKQIIFLLIVKNILLFGYYNFLRENKSFEMGFS